MKVFRIVCNVLIYLIIIMVLINTVIGYINFNNLKEDKNLIMVMKTDNYESDEKEITAYYIGIYKIITIKTQEQISYQAKLWFMEDF
ncbi:MAG: hypothetical protein PHO63_02560 [Bacilli bacterium]|nr:hypothetical protein [Bacilli bacterium]MDD4809384.1 hypothetical protein [Bacilli bacterium]